jgi:hypothetical protein
LNARNHARSGLDSAAMVRTELLNVADMPGVDRRTQGLTSVTEGLVVRGAFGKPHCVAHGAMNKVREDGLWRCQHAVAGVGDGPVVNLCGVGAYTR